MLVDINNLVSMTDANQNFSKVAKMVDDSGSAVILKNNRPRYLVLDISMMQADELASDDDVINIGRGIMQRNKAAFDELAK